MRSLELSSDSFEVSHSIIKGFWRCICYAPLAVLALIVYTSLRSSAIFPDSLDTALLHISWHPAFLNWYDPILAWAIIASWMSSRLKLDLDVAIFLYVSLLAIMLSFVFGSSEQEFGSYTDASIHWLRFALVFSFSLGMTQRLGNRPIESLLIVLFIILCLSALVVYRQRFGEYNRIYAAAMSIASFSQVTVVVLFIAIIRRNYGLTTLALCFLILTFSLTSFFLFVIIYLAFGIRSKMLSTAERIISILLIGVVIVGGIYWTYNSGQFQVIYNSWTPEVITTLDGRTNIWSYGFHLISSGVVGFFGIGFNRTPLFLNQMFFTSLFRDEVFLTSGFTTFAWHFHSIVLEYILGLGVPSLAILYAILRRIRQTWRERCHPAALIFTFFLLSQTLDYTFFRPKEVILWALILGLAEGQWRLQQGRAHPDI